MSGTDGYKASKSLLCFENSNNLKRIRSARRGFLAFFHLHEFSVFQVELLSA